MLALAYEPSAARWIFCRAAAIVSPRIYGTRLSGLKLIETPPPELPGADWVRVRTRLGGICGTDMAMITQRNHPATHLINFASFPAILGHENVGQIETMGAGVRGWRKGQRVCVEPALGCAAHGQGDLCPQCAAGRITLCEHCGDSRLPPRGLLGLNSRTGGSWGEYFVAHVQQLHAVPDGLSDEQAILVDPISSAAHAVLRRPPKSGESLLVNGSGIVALGVTASIRAMGLENRITCTVRHPYQEKMARDVGASETILLPRSLSKRQRYDKVAERVGGRRVSGRFGHQGMIGGFDLTYDCTGSGQGLTDALHWTRPRGSVVAVGTSGISLVDTTPLWFDELEIIGTNGRQIESWSGKPLHSYELIFEWATRGVMNLSLLAPRLYRLKDYQTAIADLLGRARSGIVKAAFDLRGE
jgi:threonine dehydrogenase-like Zn-dependent dehydrogenase